MVPPPEVELYHQAQRSASRQFLPNAAHPQSFPPLSLTMDKDTALVTTTVPDYHDGLHEKTNKPANESGPYGSSDNRHFQVRLNISLDSSILTATLALYQYTCDQQFHVHTSSCMGGSWSHIPGCMAERRACGPSIRVYHCWHWRHTCRYVSSRNGLYVIESPLIVLLHVANNAIGILLSVRNTAGKGSDVRTACETYTDFVYQRLRSARFAPSAPKFWGFMQGMAAFNCILSKHQC
jgi:hypothetical protein